MESPNHGGGFFLRCLVVGGEGSGLLLLIKKKCGRIPVTGFDRKGEKKDTMEVRREQKILAGGKYHSSLCGEKKSFTKQTRKKRDIEGGDL